MAKAKDAFANIPDLPPEEANEQYDAFAQPASSDDVDGKTGGAPRNLLKNLSRVLVPVMAVGVIVWLFMPDSGRPRQKVEARAIEVDTRVQENDSDALIKRMKEDATKPKPVLQTGSPATQYPTSPPISIAQAPMPTPFGLPTVRPSPATQDEIEASQKAAADIQKRVEEIRASPLEAGQIKLLGEESGGRPKSAAGELEAELARVAASQEEATAQQRMAQAATMAALANSEQVPAKQKNANQQFLLDASGAANNVVLRQHGPAGDHIINEGSSIRTVLMTSISSDLPGKVIARVTADVYDSNMACVLIPKGSQIVGVYNSEVAIGQERVLMAMNRLILPNGTWISLAGASASDMIGKSGLQAKVNNHFFKIFSTSLILGGASLLLPNSDSTVTTTSGPGGNMTSGGVFATALNDVLRTVLDRNKNIGPTLTLQYGQEFIFVVAQDMEMIPYKTC